MAASMQEDRLQQVAFPGKINRRLSFIFAVAFFLVLLVGGGSLYLAHSIFLSTEEIKGESERIDLVDRMHYTIHHFISALHRASLQVTPIEHSTRAAYLKELNALWEQYRQGSGGEKGEVVQEIPLVIADLAAVSEKIVTQTQRVGQSFAAAPDRGDLEILSDVEGRIQALAHVLNGAHRTRMEQKVRENRWKIQLILGFYAAFVLVGALLILGVSIFFSRTIARPLRLLAQGATEIAQGNFHKQVPVQSRDEIGQLSHAFNIMAAKNIEPEFLKPSNHPITSNDWTHEPREDANTMPTHVTCVDCHNPHQATSTSATPPTATGRLKGVRGINISGAMVNEAIHEYEICLKCHGVRDQTTPGAILRQDNTRNIRLKINPSNPSYHPVAAVGKHSTIPGLEPGYTASSIIYCMDCHNNDEWTPTGTRPRGPHGSRYQPILEREFQQGDPATESFQAYALCYKCHNRSALFSGRRFPHDEHVRGERASCAVCHDAHGSRQNIRLINFMLRDRTGKTVVSPSRNQGRLEFISLGAGRGQCYLQCHGENHEPENYP